MNKNLELTTVVSFLVIIGVGLQVCVLLHGVQIRPSTFFLRLSSFLILSPIRVLLPFCVYFLGGIDLEAIFIFEVVFSFEILFIFEGFCHKYF